MEQENSCYPLDRSSVELVNGDTDNYLAMFGLDGYSPIGYTPLDSEIIDTSTETGEQSEEIKFSKKFTDYEIQQKGRNFFQKDDSTDYVYKPDNMNRSFVVSIERNCFKRTLELLHLNDEEINIVKKARDLEIRKMNTRKSRHNESNSLKTQKDGNKILSNERDELKKEKQSLKTEIRFYQEHLGTNTHIFSSS